MIAARHTHAIGAQLTLSWVDGSADELGFSVERSIGTTGTFGEIVTTGPGITVFADPNVGDATTYCYRVRAFNNAGYSGYSNSACATTTQAFGLGVLRIGAGSGTVTSAPAGIVCGASCSGSYPSGTPVTLSATPSAGSSFTGWSGACSGTSTCALTMTASAAVSATFALLPSPIFSDDFQRPDSTVLGPAWTEPSGDFYIQNGKLRNGTQKTRHLAIQASLVMAGGHLTADFTSLNNKHAPSFGLVFGYRDPLNYYAAYRRAGGSPSLKIVHVVNGVENVVAQGTCANPGLSKSFHVAVSFTADTVVLSVGTWSVTASGVGVSPGNVGLMVDSGGWSHRVDNFTATP